MSGGLTVDIHGMGRTAAKEHFELDPELCEGEEGRLRDWSAIVDRSIYPLGELDDGRNFFGIDEAGELYLVVDRLGSFGPGDTGLIALCEGIMPREVRPRSG